jgi:hypothetical protein
MGYDWPPKKNWPKRHKYGAEIKRSGPHEPSGSKLERAVYGILILRERAGEIKDIRCQASVTLGTEVVTNFVTGKTRTKTIRWKVDFAFTVVKTGVRTWCEAKGMESALYRKQLRLWREGAGPGPLEIWKGSYRRPTQTDLVTPGKGKKL